MSTARRKDSGHAGGRVQSPSVSLPRVDLTPDVIRAVQLIDSLGRAAPEQLRHVEPPDLGRSLNARKVEVKRMTSTPTPLKTQFKPLAFGTFRETLKPWHSPCVSRQVRRQVLFARKRAGFSGSAPKRHYHRSLDSDFSCR